MNSMYPKSGRVILHVDMNSFFASVEVAEDPSLKGKPLAIAGDEKERRGIIVTCTYEARSFGIYTTMPLWEARRLCPSLIVKKPNFSLYKETSAKIFEHLHQITPIIQKVSIDEGYLDITECEHLGSPVEIAKQIQHDLLEQLNLPCSIGIAPNKFLAKMASDMKKPLGITILRKRDVQEVLWPLEVGEMHGIGKATTEKLNQLGIFTVEDIAKANEGLLKEKLGVMGRVMRERANGIDNRPVDPDKYEDHKSIGNSSTFSRDMTEEPLIFEKLSQLSSSVSRRLKEQHLVAGNIQLMIKFHNRKLVTRSRKLENPIVEVEDIFSAIAYLWRKHWDGEPVRLVGVTAHKLTEKKVAMKQLDLFSYEEDAKDEPLMKVVDKLQEKYGENMIKKGL